MPPIQIPSISADVAQRCIEAASAKAHEIGVPMSVAVVDPSGVLKAFLRMDGAPLLSIESARHKAYSAVAVGVPTQGLYDAYSGEPGLLGQIGALPGMAIIPGGVPITHGGKLVGGVGVGGGSGDQDVVVATAGAEAANDA